MGTNCASLLADLFLYSYEADFIQGLLNDNEKQLSLSLTFTFHDFVDLIYPMSLKQRTGFNVFVIFKKPRIMSSSYKQRKTSECLIA